MLDNTPAPAERIADDGPGGGILARDVTVTYRNGHTALRHASFEIPRGTVTALVGVNGAGKSTLCRILLEQEELDRGEIIRHPTLRVGYLQQHDPFEPGESALDFLMRDSGVLWASKPLLSSWAWSRNSRFSRS